MRKEILLFAALTVCTTLSAQIKLQGQRPTLVDFFLNYIDEPEDELTGNLANSWELYKNSKPQPEGVTFLVDTRNGYIRQECYEEYNNTRSYFEMCYWNCADGKHRLVAYNMQTFTNGKPCDGQFDGTYFALYDNAKRTLEPIEPEDLGLNLDYGIDYGSYGYDSDTKQYFWGSKAGKVTNMTKEEYDRWYKNRPLNNVVLPRQGKDIILTKDHDILRTHRTGCRAARKLIRRISCP